MAYTFTAWPTTAVVADFLTQLNLASLATSVPADIISGELTAAAKEMEKRTRRQFTTSTSTRRFDGSGTGIMTIDPYTDVTAVEFFIYPNGSINVTEFVEVEQQGHPKTKIQIFGGPLYLGRRFEVFPRERSNIGVTATWGYGTSIPEDVWFAVAKKAVGQLLNANAMNGGQRLTSWKDDDVAEQYLSGVGASSINLPSEFAGYEQEFDAVVKRYKRTPSEFRRRTAPNLNL